MGHHVATLTTSNNTSPDNYTRYMQHQVLTHRDAEAEDDASDPAILLHDEIAQRCNGGEG